MPFGNRRHIPVAIKEAMITLHTTKGLKKKEVADLLDVDVRTVRRVTRLEAETGSVVRESFLKGCRRLLNGIDCAYLESLLERTPDLYLRELQEDLVVNRGVCVSLDTISRTLHKRGFTRKKLTIPAKEQDEQLRGEYLARIQLYQPQQLVFVDESSCDRRTGRRAFGWAPQGTRSRRRECFVRGVRYSMLPALSLDGPLYLTAQQGAYNSDDFICFIDGLLDTMNQYPGTNSVIVMDNASIHKAVTLRPMIERRGMRLEYLPPYSPDLNPIEEMFSCVKAWMRSSRDYVHAELTGEIECHAYNMIWRAVSESVTPEKATGWYHDCGYI